MEQEDLRCRKKQKLGRNEKKELEKIEELKIQQTENELVNLKDDPKSADQFDRLLLGQPNNSKLWIKYMSFHLQADEFEKANNVGYKALQIINPREEQERQNIWIALLNMENLYGTKEGLQRCLEEALRANDDYKICCTMLGIFSDSNKIQELNEMVSKMCKKYKNRIDSWLCCSEVYFKLRQTDKARNLLQRALKNIPKKDHAFLISRFALLENRHGYSTEARTLFEHIVTTHPGRVDIWFCYTDMLVKSGNIDLARQVLENACSLKLPGKKMKSLFSKRLSIEQKYGDANAVKIVKEAAQKYVKDACHRE